VGDRDLISQLRRGDAAAWQQLVERYGRLVYHIVRSRLHGRAPDADIDDLVYELWADLVEDQYKALAAIGPPYDLKAYLAVSARRRAIDYARRPRRAVPLDADATAAPESEAVADPAQVRALGEAMKTLSKKEQTLVRLFYEEELKYREIARATGISMNSIGPTLQRAVEKLRSAVR
jgi:RNA polymerase sigma factor (sigma-70 family)